MDQHIQPYKKEDNNHTGKNKRTFTFSGRQLGIAIVVILGLFAALWIIKALQVKSLKNEHRQQQQALKEEAGELLAQSDQQYLKLLAKPYVWAIRTEMMNGNLNQVNLYANDLVREKNFRSIIVADDKNIIVSSTDKKLEGQNFSTVGKPVYWTSDSTFVERINDSLVVAASPVMGFNSRLGTLLITYSPQPPAFRK